jgi:signal transduction histidine kinase
MGARQMLPTSHLVPILRGKGPALTGAETLADAFSEFSAAAERLELSYQELRTEVSQLRVTLAERNRALFSSLAENSRMKLTLRQILDSLPCGVLVVEDGAAISLSNPEVRRLLGVGCESISSLEDLPDSSRAHLQAVLQDIAPESSEAEFLVADSTEKRWLAVRSRQLGRNAASPVASAGGVSTHHPTILILRDTTSQKKLEEDREAARNVIALAEVSAVLAHEIRNPLASLELFAGLIGNSGGEPGYVAQLRAGIRSLSATVNNVLRFHSGGGALQCTQLELAEFLRGAAEFVRPLAEQREIDLLLQVEAGNLAMRGDRNALQQVFLNLTLNALCHTAAGGWLRITASRTQNRQEARARVEFADNGHGIDPSLLEQIFEPGCSGSGQTPGLGLAVCRQLVEQHGGTIGVKSSIGHGTTFVLEFPIES